MKLDKEYLKIAEVYWVDSISGSGWVLTDDYKDDKPLGCYSIGILIDENEKGITIAQNVGFEPEQFCNTITIPKCAIQCIKVRVHDVNGKDMQVGAIEQLTAFAVHLNKRGAFRDDLCMDFEHEAQSFIEFQKSNATQKEK